MKRLLLVTCLVLAACQPGIPTATAVAVATPTDFSIDPTVTDSVSTTASDTPTAVPTIPASVVELEGAQVQPGFSLLKFADLPRPTAFAFDGRGQLFVASQDGNVYVVVDEDHDGRADRTTVFASGFVFALGLAIHEPTGDVYVSHQGVISVLQDANGDNRSDESRILVGDLPFGQHQNDNLEFGPDGLLYVGVGSTCDACEDTSTYAATILRINIADGAKEVFATGLRNPFDIAFHPDTGELFATDNGRDDLGMEDPGEEMNHIVQGRDYGYPHCWNAGDQPGCENTIPAIALFEAHSSADGVDFYNGQNYPAEYRGDAFVTIFGSWLKPGVQTGVQRVVLSRNGATYASQASWFVQFPAGVMPLPITFGPDDSMYVGDYINGVIYRVVYGAS